MKEFLNYLINNIINHPDSLDIQEENESGLTIYKINVHDEDMGLLIGKNGKTIKSIRSLIRAKAIKDGIRVRIELVDNKQD